MKDQIMVNIKPHILINEVANFLEMNGLKISKRSHAHIRFKGGASIFKRFRVKYPLANLSGGLIIIYPQRGDEIKVEWELDFNMFKALTFYILSPLMVFASLVFWKFKGDGFNVAFLFLLSLVPVLVYTYEVMRAQRALKVFVQTIAFLRGGGLPPSHFKA